MRRWVYFLSQALLHIRRNPFVASITVVTVAVVFLVLGVIALLGYNLNLLSERLGSGMHLSVYLMDGIRPEQEDAIFETLRASPFVEQIRKMDSKEAVLAFRKTLRDQASLIDNLGDDLLPASLEVTLAQQDETPAQIQSLAKTLATLPGVEDLQYGQGWIEQYFGFVGLARMIGGIVGVLILFSTLMIVSNTIGLSIYGRQEEIVILKLVGATDSFVKCPFYVEGILLGALGSLLGALLTWILFLWFSNSSLSLSSITHQRLQLSFLPQLGMVVMFTGGALLGLLGTILSLGRHLKT
jgi:cell division transport system permease protein